MRGTNGRARRSNGPLVPLILTLPPAQESARTVSSAGVRKDPAWTPTRSRPEEAVACAADPGRSASPGVGRGPGSGHLIEQASGCRSAGTTTRCRSTWSGFRRVICVRPEAGGDAAEPQVPWSRDVFRHDGRANLPDTRGLGPGPPRAPLSRAPGETRWSSSGTRGACRSATAIRSVTNSRSGSVPLPFPRTRSVGPAIGWNGSRGCARTLATASRRWPRTWDGSCRHPALQRSLETVALRREPSRQEPAATAGSAASRPPSRTSTVSRSSLESTVIKDKVVIPGEAESQG